MNPRDEQLFFSVLSWNGYLAPISSTSHATKSVLYLPAATYKTDYPYLSWVSNHQPPRLSDIHCLVLASVIPEKSNEAILYAMMKTPSRWYASLRLVSVSVCVCEEKDRENCEEKKTQGDWIQVFPIECMCFVLQIKATTIIITKERDHHKQGTTRHEQVKKGKSITPKPPTTNHNTTTPPSIPYTHIYPHMFILPL